jgi:hypothetical protein
MSSMPRDSVHWLDAYIYDEILRERRVKAGRHAGVIGRIGDIGGIGDIAFSTLPKSDPGCAARQVCKLEGCRRTKLMADLGVGKLSSGGLEEAIGRRCPKSAHRAHNLETPLRRTDGNWPMVRVASY